MILFKRIIGPVSAPHNAHLTINDKHLAMGGNVFRIIDHRYSTLRKQGGGLYVS